MRYEERYVHSSDGKTRLRVRFWLPEGKPAAVVQLSHGMMEHIGRYQELGQRLAGQGFAAAGHDHLGHGFSGLQNGMGFFAEKKGETFLVRDLRRVNQGLRKRYPEMPCVLLGHSMGSFLARRYAGIYGRELAGLILMGTGGQSLAAAAAGKLVCEGVSLARGPRAYSAFLEKAAMAYFCRPFRPVRTRCDWLSSVPEEVDRFLADPLCGRPFTASGYTEIFNMIISLAGLGPGEHLPKDLPVLFLSGQQDPVGGMGRGVQRVAGRYRKSGMGQVSVKLYPEARHELLHERCREEVLGDLVSWIQEKTAEQASG